MKSVSEQAKALIAEASDPDRLYPLRSHDPYGFYTGRLPDGDQAIVFWIAPEEVTIYRFKPDGEFLGAEVRPIAPQPPLPRMDELLDRMLHDHLRSHIGLEPGLVRVRRFFDANLLIGIRPVDDHHEEFAADPEAYCSDVRGEITDQLEYLRSWVAERLFVFDFYNNYWIDDTGEVESS